MGRQKEEIRRKAAQAMREMDYCAHERESLTSELVRCVMEGNSIPGSLV